ncbi:MAG: hypothetical protein ACOCUV_03210 [bacterium]
MEAFCPECKKEIIYGAKICKSCKSPIVYCSQCKEAQVEGFLLCKACGQAAKRSNIVNSLFVDREIKVVNKIPYSMVFVVFPLAFITSFALIMVLDLYANFTIDEEHATLFYLITFYTLLSLTLPFMFNNFQNIIGTVYRFSLIFFIVIICALFITYYPIMMGVNFSMLGIVSHSLFLLAAIFYYGIFRVSLFKILLFFVIIQAILKLTTIILSLIIGDYSDFTIVPELSVVIFFMIQFSIIKHFVLDNLEFKKQGSACR